MTDEGPGPIAGWLLGHELARDHSGFPGDPLPDGHLGRPADLAFWGSLSETEDDDVDTGHDLAAEADDCWDADEVDSD